MSYHVGRSTTGFLKRLCMAALASLLTAGLAPAQQIVAHRGASHDAPENTLAAFRLGWEQGADAIEGDFFLTRDGEIVCLHDETTERTGDRNLLVAESTLEELREVDVGAFQDARFVGERIPTLAQVFGTVPEGKRVYLEVKCGPEIVPALESVLESSSLSRSQTLFLSFHADVVRRLKQAMPERQAYWLTGFEQDEATGLWSPTLMEVLETLEGVGADGLHVEAHDQVDALFVQAVQRKGLALGVWTLNEPDAARRFQELGVDSITTDRPAFLREALGARTESTRGYLGRPRSTLGLKPPAQALVCLAPGIHPEALMLEKDPEAPLKWDLDLSAGVLRVVPGTGDVCTRAKLADLRLHLEFLVNESDYPWGNRGNSGVYIQRRYEVQILDSHGRELTTQDCGSLYRTRQPDVNASLPAGQWQTFDVAFRQPRWEGDRKVANARISVLHNGALIHNDVEIPGKTGAGRAEGPELDHVRLQDHGNAVQFRNFWIEEIR